MLNYFASYLQYLKTGKIAGKPPKSGGDTPVDMVRVEDYREGLANITASHVRDALAAADEGDPRVQAAYASSIVDGRDAMIAAHWRTRKLAVTGSEWDVCPVDDADKGRAMEIRKAIDSAGISRVVSSLLDAVYFGYSGVMTEWDRSGLPVRFVPVHPTRFVFDFGGNPAIMLGGTGTGTPVGGMEYGSMIYCHDSSTSVTPAKAGICRSLLWMWLLKRDAWLSRARYLERFGMPFRKVKVTEEQWKNKAGLAALKSMLQKSGEVGLAILPDGTDMDVQTVSGGSSSSDYSEYIDDIDDVITVAILGQTATSGDAGGLSKGQAQENVRRDLVRSDAKLIMDAINRHLLAPMCRFRYGDGSVGAFEFRIDCDPSDDMERKATTVSTLAAAGYKPEPAWVAETFNMPLEEKSEVRDPGMPFSDLPLSSSDLAEEEFVSRLTRNALERMFASKTVINEFYGPLRKEIGKAFSDLSVDDPNLSSEFARRAESMFSRYPEIYEEMGAGSSGFQKVFSDAVLTAVAGKSIPLARAR